MKCNACGHQNRKGVAFCEQCGASLNVSTQPVCTARGASNRSGVAFCESCGAQLGAGQMPAALGPAGVMPVLMPEPDQREGQDKRTWLAMLLGMLLTASVCCIGILILPHPPVEGSILPEPVEMLWESAVESRDGIMQASGLTGGLVSHLRSILPASDQQQPKGEKKEAAQVNPKCKPDIFDEAQCKAVDGELLWDWQGAKYCNCPGKKQDEGWCKAEKGSWDAKNKNCSFYNTCSDGGWFWGDNPECKKKDGFLDLNCANEFNNKGQQKCQCFCPNPAFTGQACKQQAEKIKITAGPECGRDFCAIDVDIGGKLNQGSKMDGAVLQTDFGQVILDQIWVNPNNNNPNEVTFWADNLNLPQGFNPAVGNPKICWGGCCYEMDVKTGKAKIFKLWEGEGEQPAEEKKPIALVQPEAKPTCCQQVSARNVKYFRDPPSIGSLFLGFDMQCDQPWELGGGTASFDALVGASRNIHWSSGECKPDPNNPNRLNCAGSIEGQKKSMTKIVMRYGSCTAEAEFQSPYQEPPSPEPKPDKKKKEPCPPGQSMCAGRCCSDGHCSQDDDGSWGCYEY